METFELFVDAKSESTRVSVITGGEKERSSSRFTAIAVPLSQSDVIFRIPTVPLQMRRCRGNSGFCAASGNQLLPGACLISNSTLKHICQGDHRPWFTRGCPSRFGWLVVVGLALYIIFFSPGMGTVPWVTNSEIYPLQYRGTCGGIAATANWISNLVVSQTFLTMTENISVSLSFLVFGIISVLALFFVVAIVPETKGLNLEEVESMLHDRVKKFSFIFGKIDDHPTQGEAGEEQDDVEGAHA